MSTEPRTRARIHTHAGNVAVRIGHSEIIGECPTQYISPDLAIRLGKELIEAGNQEKNAYHYGTKTVSS